MSRLAVCLLTADRPGFTLITLASFQMANHPLRDLVLLHADDGSISGANEELAKMAGFKTVYRAPERRGQGPALRAMWSAAAEADCNQILHLENDIESVASIPRHFGMRYSIRLYGAQKARSGPRAETGGHIIGTKEPIVWRPFCEGWEWADAHWGGQPSITPTAWLLPAVQDAVRLKDVSLALPRIPTLRPIENICWHVGDEPTPNRVN